ncbi:MAG: proline dehydrogenase family protein [Gemmatimonadota bacterium]|nr:MAG: proline dehydrogenase family protein [Gemmatimonadota bacterium]
MGLARQALLWASRRKWLGAKFQAWSFTRRASRRFLPGEDLEAALEAVVKLGDEGISSLITLLGENVSTTAEVQDVVRQYQTTLCQIQSRAADCQLSIKPTQLGMDLGGDSCEQGLFALLPHAAGDLVWVDMESSGYVDRTLDLIETVNSTHKNIGVCLQAYLHRTDGDLDRLVSRGIPVRLVKGAYREPASVAIRKKKDVDVNYLKLGCRLLDAVAAGKGGPAAFATHDMNLVRSIQEYSVKRSVPGDAFEFEMLYGVGREHQRRLVAEGFRVRVLVSYGSAWFPWYMRRLAERPANVWFVARSLVSRWGSGGGGDPTASEPLNSGLSKTVK